MGPGKRRNRPSRSQGASRVADTKEEDNAAAKVQNEIRWAANHERVGVRPSCATVLLSGDNAPKSAIRQGNGACSLAGYSL